MLRMAIRVHCSWKNGRLAFFQECLWTPRSGSLVFSRGCRGAGRDAPYRPGSVWPHDGDFDDEIVEAARFMAPQYGLARRGFPPVSCSAPWIWCATAFRRRLGILGAVTVAGAAFHAIMLAQQRSKPLARQGEHPQRQHIHLEHAERLGIVLVPGDRRRGSSSRLVRMGTSSSRRPCPTTKLPGRRERWRGKPVSRAGQFDAKRQPPVPRILASKPHGSSPGADGAPASNYNRTKSLASAAETSSERPDALPTSRTAPRVAVANDGGA